MGMGGGDIYIYALYLYVPTVQIHCTYSTNTLYLQYKYAVPTVYIPVATVYVPVATVYVPVATVYALYLHKKDRNKGLTFNTMHLHP